VEGCLQDFEQLLAMKNVAYLYRVAKTLVDYAQFLVYKSVQAVCKSAGSHLTPVIIHGIKPLRN
jgi:hypothetical protein